MESFDDVILDSEIIKEFSHFFNGIRLASEENIQSFVTSVEHRRNI
jgi:hypothetical protein